MTDRQTSGAGAAATDGPSTDEADPDRPGADGSSADGSATPGPVDDDPLVGPGGPSYRPTSVAGGVALVSALTVALLALGASLGAFALAGLGAWFLLVALVRGHGTLVSGGSTLLFAGVLLSGIAGAPELTLLVAAVATVLAYDGGHYAVRLGRQFGRHPATARPELVHLGTTLAGAGGAGLVGYVVFELGAGGQPTSALVALLVAAALLVSALYLRRDDSDDVR